MYEVRKDEAVKPDFNSLYKHLSKSAYFHIQQMVHRCTYITILTSSSFELGP